VPPRLAPVGRLTAPPACEGGIVGVARTVDRRAWGILRGRFRADELATPRSGASRPPRGPRLARPRETTFTRTAVENTASPRRTTR
jgi:hypothetical protein